MALDLDCSTIPKCCYYRCEQPAEYVLIHRLGPTTQEPVCQQHLAISQQGADTVDRVEQDGTRRQIS